MKFFSWSVWNKATLLGLVSLFWLSCTAPAPGPRWKWMVMTTDLVRDSALIRIYDSMHSVNGVWPELTKANKASGIEEIRIYRFDNRLVMMLRIPEGADLKKMDSLYVGADPKVAEWGKLMNGFQRALPGMDSMRKWVEMSLIHHYEGGAYLEK
jgi:L-rhamnose mutarotase